MLKNLKAFKVLLICVFMIFSLCACSGEKASSGSKSANNNSGDVYIPRVQQETPNFQSREKSSSICWTCKGAGTCNFCDGSGIYLFYPEWAGDSCRTCGGTGRCPACNGRGTI